MMKAKEGKMDLIFRVRNGKALTIHVKSPSYDPAPGGDPDGFGVCRVVGAPDETPVSELLNIFNDIDHSAPRFLWTWEDFLGRVPTGPSLTLEECAEKVGIAAFTLRKAIVAGRLPARQASYEGFAGGSRPWLVNEFDLRWFAKCNRPPMGRPKKKAGEDD